MGRSISGAQGRRAAAHPGRIQYTRMKSLSNPAFSMSATYENAQFAAGKDVF
jgi:hypothetical protein